MNRTSIATAKESLDRLVDLAARLLSAPITFLIVATHGRLALSSFNGLPETVDRDLGFPGDSLIGRHVLRGESFVVEDARADIWRDDTVLAPLGIVSLAAAPLLSDSREVLGAFCAASPCARDWTVGELEALLQLSHSATTELALRQMLRQLESELRVRERMLARLTHDIRTPLTAARLMTELVQIGLEGEKMPLAEKCRRILGNIDRAESLIRQITQTGSPAKIQDRDGGS